MNKRQCGLFLVMAGIAGFIGGVVSNQFLIGEPVFAQKELQSQKVVEANKFILRDSDGIIRGEWGTENVLFRGEKEVYFRLNWYTTGESGFRVALGGDWPSLALFDRHGVTRGVLWSDNAKGGAQLRLCDESGRDRAIIGWVELKQRRTGAIEKRPVSSIVLFNEDEKIIWSAPNW